MIGDFKLMVQNISDVYWILVILALIGLLFGIGIHWFFIILALIGLVLGMKIFLWGFNFLRKKNIVQNLRTATISSSSLGLVELTGHAEAIKPLTSPISEQRCILYKYLVDECQRNNRWKDIASGDNFSFPFWLNDGTGRIMVFPRNAEISLPVGFGFVTEFLKKTPRSVEKFMERNNIRKKGLLLKRPICFTEWLIRPKDEIRVLGAVKNMRNSDVSAYKKLFLKQIKELEEYAEKRKEIELNKDHTIIPEDCARTARMLREEVLEKTFGASGKQKPKHNVMLKGKKDPVFLICDRIGKELTASSSLDCFLGLYLGAGLSIISLASFLFFARRLAFFQNMPFVTAGEGSLLGFIVLAALLLLALGACLSFVLAYRSILQLSREIEKTWAALIALLKERHAEIPGLLGKCETLLPYERDKLSRIGVARTECINASEIKDMAEKESALEQALENLFESSEKYPDIRKNKDLLDLEYRTKDLKTRINSLRDLYNDSVSRYNVMLYQFPDIWVTDMLNLRKKKLFSVSDQDGEILNRKFEHPKETIRQV